MLTYITQWTKEKRFIFLSNHFFFLNEENREEFSSCVFIIVQYNISDRLKGFLVWYYFLNKMDFTDVYI